MVSDFLKNPRLCHVMGQPIVAPFVIRVTTAEQLTQQSSTFRTYNDELFYHIEKMEDDAYAAQAERICENIFADVGHTVEQYVKTFGNTMAIEEYFEGWAFGQYWKQNPRSLTKEGLLSNNST